jgi:hypothetical protein
MRYTTKQSEFQKDMYINDFYFDGSPVCSTSTYLALTFFRAPPAPGVLALIDEGGLDGDKGDVGGASVELELEFSGTNDSDKPEGTLRWTDAGSGGTGGTGDEDGGFAAPTADCGRGGGARPVARPGEAVCAREGGGGGAAGAASSVLPACNRCSHELMQSKW